MFHPRRAMRWGAVLLAAAIVPALGCEESVPFPNTVDLRDGTWEITTTTTVIGVSSRCKGIPPRIEVVEEVLCEAGADQFTEFDGIEDCFVQFNSSGYSVDCSGTIFFDPCTLTFTMDGEGAYNDTTFTAVLLQTTTVDGPSGACGEFPCTNRIEISAVWLSSEGECPEAGLEPNAPTRPRR